MAVSVDFLSVCRKLAQAHPVYAKRIESGFWYADESIIAPGKGIFPARVLRDTTCNEHGYWVPNLEIMNHIAAQANEEIVRLLDADPPKRNPHFQHFPVNYDAALALKQIDDTVRLSSFSNSSASIGKATYLDQIGTNITADSVIRDGKYNGKTVRQIDTNLDGSLKPLDKCIAANTIGVACIAIDRNGELMFPFRKFDPNQKRADSVQNRLGAMERGWHCYSSGVLTWSDMTSKSKTAFKSMSRGKFIQGLKYGILREVFFETGMNPFEIGVEITLYGFARELKRIGKPQFFFLLKFKELSFDEIRRQIDYNSSAGLVEEDFEYGGRHRKILDKLRLKERRITKAREFAKPDCRFNNLCESVIEKWSRDGFLHSDGTRPTLTYELYGALLMLTRWKNESRS